MRARSLKPGFFDNDVLGTVSPMAQLLFAGLWCYADWQGRLEYRPLRIKARIFPYRNADIDALADELETGGVVVRYGDENGRYLWIRNFEKHQKPHPNEKKTPSKYPAYSRETTDTHLGTSVDTPRSGAVRLNPSSLNPSSLNPSSLNPAGDACEAQAPQPSQSHQDRFIELWNAMADETGVPQCLTLTGKRLTAFKARLKEPGWAGSYHDGIEAIKRSAFLCGKNDRGWKANVEWFLRPDSLTKIMERSYESDRPDHSIPSPDDSAGRFWESSPV